MHVFSVVMGVLIFAVSLLLRSRRQRRSHSFGYWIVFAILGIGFVLMERSLWDYYMTAFAGNE